MTDMAPGPAPEAPDGQIVTFYSYKGGTGRTMALANVAWILAANGHRVLVADWDLESPGLHRFLHPFLAASHVRDASGIIDLIRGYEWAAINAAAPGPQPELIREHARVEQHALSLDWQFPEGGSLEFLSAGRQNRDYAASLSALDWDNFYEALAGGEFFDALRADMKRSYDYVLIDSRSGLSDEADICTVHLPDTLVDCFTLSTQGIEGAAQVAKLISERYGDRGIRILPVPMRVDPSEKERVDVGRAFTYRLFDGLPAGLSEAERREYWAAVEVPYRPYYSYEETLAVFGDVPGYPSSLLASFERLTAQITLTAVTALPPMDEELRTRASMLFTRSLGAAVDTVVLEFCPEDRLWAEWVTSLLQNAGLPVRERSLTEPAQWSKQDRERTVTLAVISAAYATRYASRPPNQAQPDLAVYVTATRPLADIAPAAAAFLAELTEPQAVERLHQLLGIPSRASDEGLGRPPVRYPGSEPKIDRTPARNVRFTGREHDLLQLREELRSYGTAAVLALQGLGGVGKTQLALEYAHRFRAEYDLLWWVNCAQPQYIDASLAELGEQARAVFTPEAPLPVDAPDATRQVLHMLSTDGSVPRWLLVFDGADDLEAVRPYLPSGGGHVVITSRNGGWTEHTRTIPVDVFTREESVAHLRQRVPSITVAEADEVAEVLGDLPLAVATAGAWLAETGFTVSEYLSQLAQEVPATLSISQLADYPRPVSQAWDLSLNRLLERSPAAARLLELCSVMAPSIDLRIVYSEAMASVLLPYDPALSERIVIGRVVQEINRLALIKLDPVAGQISVHPLVQAVVRDRMSPEQLEAARRDVHQVLAAARPHNSVDDPETWSRFRAIWPHLTPPQAMLSTAEPVRQLCIDRVRYLWQRHDLDRASTLAAELGETWAAMLAEEPDPAAAASLHRQLLQLRAQLGGILRDQTRFDEARELNTAVLREQRELLGREHPHTLTTAGNLAADMRASGHYRDALEIDEATHPVWEEQYGRDYRATLAAAASLATSYRLTGDISRAVQLDEDTLQRLHAVLGPQHPRTLESASSLASDLLAAGRYAEAVACLEAILDAYIGTLGPESFEALRARAQLGIALRCTGRYPQAEDQLVMAQNGLASWGGASTSELLACRLGRAMNMLATGRAADAELAIRDVHAAYQDRLGAAHPDALVCLVDLASTLRVTDRPAAMEPVDLAVEGLRDVLGSAHPHALAARMARGVLLAEAGNLAGAARVEQEAGAGLASVLGEIHPDTLRCRCNLLLNQEEAGNPAADAERSQLIVQLSGLIGDTHPDIAALRQNKRLMPVLDAQPF